MELENKLRFINEESFDYYSFLVKLVNAMAKERGDKNE